MAETGNGPPSMDCRIAAAWSVVATPQGQRDQAPAIDGLGLVQGDLARRGPRSVRRSPRTPRSGPPWPATAAAGCRARAARRGCEAAPPPLAPARSPSTSPRAAPARRARPRGGTPRRPGRARCRAGAPGRATPRPAQPLGGGAGPPERDERDLAGVEEQPVVADASCHGQRLVGQAAALGIRRAVVELVGQTEQHPAAQRDRRPRAAGPGCAAARRRSRGCVLPWAADCHSAPWVVAMAARATSSTSPSSSRDRDRLLDGGRQLRPHGRPAVGVDEVHQHVVAVAWRGVGVVGHGRRGRCAAARRTAGARRGDGPRPPPRPPSARPCRRTTDRPRSSAAARSVARSGWCSSASATRACTRARRVALSPAVSVSRTRAWAKVNRSTPDVADQPGGLGRLDDVEQGVLVHPGRPGQGARVEAAADHRRGPQHGRPSPRGAGRGDGPARPARPRAAAPRLSSRARSARSPASRAYSTTKNGLPSVRSARASAWSSVGRLCATAAKTSPTPAAGSPVSARRTACRRARLSATSASAPGRLGAVAPRGQHQQPLVGRGLGQQPEHPQAARVGPVEVVEDEQHAARRGLPRGRRRAIRAKPSNWAASSSSVTRERGVERLQHLGPRPQRRRDVVLGAPADAHPRSPGTGQRGQLRGQPRLADARLAR